MMLVHTSDLGNHEKKKFDKVFVEILLSSPNCMKKNHVIQHRDTLSLSYE